MSYANFLVQTVFLFFRFSGYFIAMSNWAISYANLRAVHIFVFLSNVYQIVQKIFSILNIGQYKYGSPPKYYGCVVPKLSTTSSSRSWCVINEYWIELTMETLSPTPKYHEDIVRSLIPWRHYPQPNIMETLSPNPKYHGHIVPLVHIDQIRSQTWKRSHCIV